MKIAVFSYSNFPFPSKNVEFNVKMLLKAGLTTNKKIIKAMECGTKESSSYCSSRGLSAECMGGADDSPVLQSQRGPSTTSRWSE